VAHRGKSTGRVASTNELIGWVLSWFRGKREFLLDRRARFGLVGVYGE